MLTQPRLFSQAGSSGDREEVVQTGARKKDGPREAWTLTPTLHLSVILWIWIKGPQCATEQGEHRALAPLTTR